MSGSLVGYIISLIDHNAGPYFMAFYIIKSSGEKEEFSVKKFRRSLRKSGAQDATIDRILEEIKRLRPKTTQEIFSYAIKRLEEEDRPIAARYNLKHAIMELGPAGYPFELFVAEVLRHQGYEAQQGKIVSGFCVDHEVDVVAIKDNKHFMIECKFHNRSGLKSDVKVALYIQARFQDVHKAWEQEHKSAHSFHQAWIITNTRFTSEAEKYAACIDIKLIDFSYPRNESLAAMTDKAGLHPITVLTGISRSQKRQLIKNGLILCRDTQKHKDLLHSVGLTTHEVDKLIKESETICKLGLITDEE